MVYKKRACPGCDSEFCGETAVHGEINPVDLSMDEMAPYWNGFYKEKIIFPYGRCTNCGLMFSPIYFTDAQLKDLYAQMPPNMDVVPKDSLIRTQAGYYDLIRDEIKDDGAYLEIGADIGLFTINCINGKDFNAYWLVEPNETVHSDLIKLVSGSKHTILKDMDGLSPVPNETVSFVAMIHVLDHLTDPIASLKEIQGKMKAGSRLLIVTHDESSLLRRILNARWPAFCLQHPQLFNKKTLTAMLGRSGFKVIKQVRTNNEFPISFLVKQLLWALGLKANKVPSFFGWKTSLSLGNILTLAEPIRSVTNEQKIN